MIEDIEPLTENINHPFVPLVDLEKFKDEDAILLVTEEDCSPETSMREHNLEMEIVPLYRKKKFPEWIEPLDTVRSFSNTAVQNSAQRLRCKNLKAVKETNWTEKILDASDKLGTKNIITPKIPIGAVKSELRKIKKNLAKHDIYINEHYRDYDINTWQYASKGFFKLKKQIPNILYQLGL